MGILGARGSWHLPFTAAHPEPVPKAGLRRDALDKREISGGRDTTHPMKRIRLGQKPGSDPSQEARPVSAIPHPASREQE